MFDLEKAILDWREEMLAAGVRAPVPLDELESHLHDEIERQLENEVDFQTAFESAVQKIGATASLHGEFKKVDAAKSDKKLEWRLIVFASITIFFCARGLVKEELSATWRLAGWANVAVMFLASFGWRYISSSFPVILNQRTRRAIGLGSIVLALGIFSVVVNLVLPTLDLTHEEITILFLWGLTLMGAASVFAAGLGEAARHRAEAMNV